MGNGLAYDSYRKQVPGLFAPAWRDCYYPYCEAFMYINTDLNMIKYFCNFILLLPLFCNAQQVQLFSESLNQYQNVRDFCITQSGDEAYFTVQSANQDLSQIVCVKKNDKGWGEPILLPFCNQFIYMEPFLFNNDKELYFVSDRPVADTSKTKKDFDIWYVSRKDKQSAWSKPINLGAPVNTQLDEFYPSLSQNKNLYFTLDAPNGAGKDDIYFCKWNGSGYEKPVFLNQNINSEGHEFNAYVAIDESYLIYTKYNAKDGFGSGDLYISKKDIQGNWLTATNMGNIINTKYMEYCPYYDMHNEMLYFTSKRNELKPTKFDDFESYQKYIDGGMNGMSRIYYLKLKID